MFFIYRQVVEGMTLTVIWRGMTLINPFSHGHHTLFLQADNIFCNLPEQDGITDRPHDTVRYGIILLSTADCGCTLNTGISGYILQVRITARPPQVSLNPY